jgi:hypothetical protein
MGDAERTKDRQTCIKLGPGVLGSQMEMHSSLIASLLLFTQLLFSLFKTLLLKSSFLFFKDSFLRLALSHVFS